MRALTPLWLGRVDYEVADRLQHSLVDLRADGGCGDLLLLLEHPPTLTWSYTGRGAEHLLASADELRRRGVTCCSTDRGGSITAHGPGQLVGYPIVSLDGEDRDPVRYLRRLEEALIRAVGRWGLDTARVPGRTGTWLPDGSRKLAAIGVKVSRWVTLHGFALNVSTDLGLFDLITPCGIADAGVTSLRRELGAAAPPLDEVAAAVADELVGVLGCVLGDQPRPAVRALLDDLGLDADAVSEAPCPR